MHISQRYYYTSTLRSSFSRMLYPTTTSEYVARGKCHARFPALNANNKKLSRTLVQFAGR